MNDKTTISYTVCCQISSDQNAKNWIKWLVEGHIQGVINGGAVKAELVELATEENYRSFEVRYEFASEKDFVTYQKDHAPALQEEGLKLFPPENGFKYSRTNGKFLFKS